MATGNTGCRAAGLHRRIKGAGQEKDNSARPDAASARPRNHGVAADPHIIPSSRTGRASSASERALRADLEHAVFPLHFLSWCRVNPTVVRTCLLLCLVLLAAACGPRPAPDISGRWKAVNRYAEQTEEIPLYQTYMFQAAPMDRTLKTMLERWAKDSKMTLVYQHSSDFTLHAPVAQLHTTNLQEAVSQLSSIYAAQQVLVTADSTRIVVRRGGIDATPAPDSGTGG